MSPEVNDADSNGVLDTEQLSEASQAVANAEQAKPQWIRSYLRLHQMV